MLDTTEVVDVASELWRKHWAEMAGHDQVRGYMTGELGKPTLPDDPDDEIRELARLSVKNVMPLVVDTFVDALSVTGFRAASETTDAAVWGIWQRERMDARQSQVFRAAVTYGAAYLLVEPGPDGVRFNPRSPRRMFAAYADPTRDEWPTYALETWTEKDNGKTIRRGLLWDDEASYEIIVRGSSSTSRVEAVEDSTPTPHGAGVCPVVRFVNAGEVEDMVTGEVAPLINDQKALNAVNFDRMVVSRFGAFPQKYLMGWAPDSADQLGVMSARRLLAFDDPDTKAGAFPSADVSSYNTIIEEILSYIATKARVQVHSITGKFSNIGSDTIALIDSPNQRKVASKRLSFGESLEQALRLGGRLEGIDVPDGAEVVWDDTEARSFAQVVDGIVKLVSAGVPVRDTIDMIPGLTQQKVDSILADLDRADAQSLTATLVRSVDATGAQTEAGASKEQADAMSAKFDALGVAIRAGVNPEDAARVLGLPDIGFTGAVPVSLRLPQTDAAELESASEAK